MKGAKENEYEVTVIVVGREVVRDKVHAPKEVGACLFVLSLTTIRDRQTAITGKLKLEKLTT